MATASSLQIYAPPQGLVPLTDPSWGRWFTEVVWPIIGAGTAQSGPQGTFPQLQIGKARWTTDNAFQELINVDQGIYVNYYSTVEQIVYGFACNVHRAKGKSLTVGAQINSWGELGSTGDIYGIACTALTQPFTGTRAIVAIEPDMLNQSSTNSAVKWGCALTFKDRFDGVATVVEGLGSNLYNYSAWGLILTSQGRSSAGERCGWEVGIQFIDGCLDAPVPPAWSAAITYQAGQLVTSGGFLWKAILTNTNVAPAVGATWVQYAINAVAFATGIDFSCLSITTMGRMWSAIRLRNLMVFHWEETGVIGTFFDAANTRHVISANWNGAAYVRNLQVDVTNGNLWVQNGITGLGGGAAPTFGTIGGAGPAVAAQRGWYKMIDNTTGLPFFVPVWQ